MLKLLPLLFALLLAPAAESPVADAAQRGDVEAVRALLRDGADVNAALGDGMTGLHWAAERGDDALAAVLIEAGAEAERTTRLGAYRPLHLAAKGGHAAIARRLLDDGAAVDPETSTGAVTPLHLAAAAGAPETVRVLLEHGADVDRLESQAVAGYLKQRQSIAQALNRETAVSPRIEQSAYRHVAADP